MTFTEDREVFERQLMRPPHAARLMEHAGRFVGHLNDNDKEFLLELAIEWLWGARSSVKETQDILTLWIKGLEYAARRRPKWHLRDIAGRDWWVKGSQLGRQQS